MNTSNIFFLPWVGQRYSQGINGKKVLILGESHHCDDKKGCSNCDEYILKNEECIDFTKGVLRSYIGYLKGDLDFDKWMNSFTKFANIFKGEKLSNTDLISFWNSVAFYNYVQKAVSEARVSPIREDFDKSFVAFQELINNLNPDLVIIWGLRLWDNLPKNGNFTKNFNSDIESTYYLENKGEKILCFVICHPSSSRFSYKYSNELAKLIQL